MYIYIYIYIRGTYRSELCKVTVYWHEESKQFFVEAPLWTEFRKTETLFVMPFSFQTKIKEYCGDLFGMVKWSRYRPGVAQRLVRGIDLLLHDRGTERCGCSAPHPSRTLPSGKNRYPFYRKQGGSQGRPGGAENLVPTGIRSRTEQPVFSRYTDWSIRPM